MDFTVFTVDQFSDHLRAFRKARGWTQEQLGALIGVKQARMADIENDPGSVSLAQMHQILSVLGAQVVLRSDVSSAPTGARPPKPPRLRRDSATGAFVDHDPGHADARPPSGPWRGASGGVGSQSSTATKIIPVSKPRRGSW